MSDRTQSQRDQIRNQPGIIAALDQSGGSIATVLANYGVTVPKPASSPIDGGTGVASLDDVAMDAVHAMRERIITSGAFGNDRVIAAIIFPATMDRFIDGVASAIYLWERKGIVPFMRCDQGLEPERHGAQMLRPIPQLQGLLARGREAAVFGTKMRSVISQLTATSVETIVDQQFTIGQQILAAGLVPILEPEVSISCPDKAEVEAQLVSHLLTRLDDLGDQEVMFKLTIPEVDNLYQPLMEHPNTIRVVALSGGYSRPVATERLARNQGMIASFSRALTSDLRVDQTAEEFDQTLDQAIASIYAASLS